MLLFHPGPRQFEWSWRDNVIPTSLSTATKLERLLHSNFVGGDWPVWVRLWMIRLLGVVKPLPQYGHMWSLTPVWVFMCIASEPDPHNLEGVVSFRVASNRKLTACRRRRTRGSWCRCGSCCGRRGWCSARRLSRKLNRWSFFRWRAPSCVPTGGTTVRKTFRTTCTGKAFRRCEFVCVSSDRQILQNLYRTRYTSVFSPRRAPATPN